MKKLKQIPDQASCGSVAAQCGAKDRQGKPCQSPAMKNGRCRLHGGLSTGAKTPAGIEAIRRGRTKHGYYTKAAREERRRERAEIKALFMEIANLKRFLNE